MLDLELPFHESIINWVKYYKERVRSEKYALLELTLIRVPYNRKKKTGKSRTFPDRKNSGNFENFHELW